MPLWQFSESSQPILDLCIETSKRKESNKWMKKFGHLNSYNTENITDNNSDNQAVITPESSSSHSVSNLATVIIEKADICEDVWLEIVELDPVVQFDYIVENCLNNPVLYSTLAKKLPLASIEKLSYHIMKLKDVNSIFFENFYKKFLPVIFKRDNMRLSFDMLIKAEKRNDLLFKLLLDIIIKDLELPSQIFQQYVSTLNSKKQIEVMKIIIASDISNEVFIHHLYAIHMLYKSCYVKEDIQKYILTKLQNVSQLCVNEKNYGRFLLSFLQNQKDFDTNLDVLQKIVDAHRSPFKKPCINVLTELKKGNEFVMDTD